MSTVYSYPELVILDLYLFGEGGEGGEGTTAETAPIATEETGVESRDAGDEKPVDLEAEFDALIKDKYKDVYGKRVQKTVQERFKNTRAIEEKLNKLSPALELLAKRNNVDANDIDALVSAIEDDDSLYSDEAFQNGVPVAVQKKMSKLARENAKYAAEVQEKQRREAFMRDYNEWSNQANQIRNLYPGIDIDAELQNPQFMSMLKCGVPVKAAYEVLHNGEIMPAVLQKAVEETERKVTEKIRAGAARPTENGNSSASSATTKFDFTKMSKEDFKKFEEKVMRGEIKR